MEKYNAEPVKVYLNSSMETIRGYSIMKNVAQIKNFQRNTGHLWNSKHNQDYIFKKMSTIKKNKYLLFMFE